MAMNIPEIPPHQKLLLSPAEVIALTGLGQHLVYEAIATGRLASVAPTPKGDHKHVRRSDLDAWLASLPVAVPPPATRMTA